MNPNDSLFTVIGMFDTGGRKMVLCDESAGWLDVRGVNQPSTPLPAGLQSNDRSALLLEKPVLLSKLFEE